MFKQIAFALLSIVALSARADWNYEDHPDRMTSGTIKHAIIGSENSLALGFPYSGPNYGSLHIHQAGKSRLHAAVKIQKGQVLCHHDNCSITVRFDDAKPVEFEGALGDDGRPTAVYFVNPGRFVARAIKAKSILVRVNLFHEGAPVLEFKSEVPLVWALKK